MGETSAEDFSNVLFAEIKETEIGEKITEGKTKQVFSLANNLCLVVSKDRITAGDGVKSHEMKGKAVLSTRTNGALFHFLSRAGVPTHFVASRVDSETSFVAKRCAMVPIEWVCRRIATGSFLKRNPNVSEGMYDVIEWQPITCLLRHALLSAQIGALL